MATAPKPRSTTRTPAPAPAASKSSKLPLIIGGVLVLAVVIGGAIAIAAHKSNSMDMAMSSTAPDATTATATNAVTIQSYAFGPKAITVKAGTTVTWTNMDSVQHTITSDSGTMLASKLFGRGETFSYTFKTAGTYTYHCTPHPYMKGTVVVTN